MFLRKSFKPQIHAALTALLLATAAPAWADNSTQFQQATAAYQAGDYSQALRLWQPLAQQGDAKAQFNLGVLYQSGQGVAQDYQQAAAWWQKAAAQGHATACFHLGRLYLTGKGVAKDYQQAKMWFEKALAQPDTADNADAKSNARLGLQVLGEMGVR